MRVRNIQIKTSFVRVLKSSFKLIKLIVKFVSKSIVKINSLIIRRLHIRLSSKFRWYSRWWEWKFHKHVHIAAGSLAALAVVLAIVTQSHGVFALSYWTQSDWSGGVGSSTSNQYSSGSNVVTSTANQVTQSIPSNLITNSNFATNLNSWQGGLSPSSITGLESWYNAGSISGVSNGANVSAWSDSSGNGHNLSQATTNDQPLLETSDINSLPAVRFNGSTDYMAGTASGFTNQATVISMQTVKSAVYGGTYEFGINSGVNTGISNLPWGGTMYARSDGIGAGDITWAYTTPTTNILTQEYNGGTTSGQAWWDGVSKGTTTTNSSYNSTINTLTVGALTPTAYFENTDLAELIAYNVALTTTQRQGIEGYLANKYNDTNANYLTSSQSTAQAYTGDSASAKLVTGTNGGDFVQYVNAGNTSTYNLTAFVYDGGTAVTSSVAQLYYNTGAVTTTYTSEGSGWYELSASVSGINASTAYGVSVSPSQTIYVDNVSLQLPVPNGVLVSNIFNTGVEENWSNLTFSDTVPSGTSVSVYVRSGNQANLSDAPAWTSCSAISSGNAITSSCAPNATQYVQYEIVFTSNGFATPTFTNISISYSPTDTTPPATNASSIAAYDGNGGTSVSSGGWANTDPYFTWTAATDHNGGSGIAGYCLYLGTSSSGNPVTSSGDLGGTSPLSTGGACPFAISSTHIDTSIAGYLATALTSSTSPYYLNIDAITGAGVVWNGSVAQFEFDYDNTPPTNPAFISAPSEFVSSDDVTLTWPTTGGDAAADSISGVAGLQYKIGSNGTWYGASHTGAQNCTDLLTNNGSYTMNSTYDYPDLVQGDNIVYFRTYNDACDVSPADITTVIKLNSTAPSSPQNLEASPSTNTTNSFSFTWLAPATFQGSASNITYCYTVNALPTSNNCTFTTAGATSLPTGAYATQPGDNTMYLVAKDEAGNINYATATSTTFTANTPAPGIPLELDIADVSVKATSSWKLALSWNTPTDVGAGIATYDVYRSTDDTNFTKIASTSGASYVDTGLSQQTYYYKVDACDSANNCGAFTSVVSLLPTGKFTSPANLVSGPTVSVTTRTATINWVTDRTSDSSVEYGISSGNYYPTQASNSDQVTAHSITINNLQAGTTYYYRALWTDEDGNIGSSSEDTFVTLPAPTVSAVTVTGINLYNATVNFTSNNATAIQLVYGNAQTQTLNTSTNTSSYSIPLTGLSPGTTYTFTLNPYDTSGFIYNNLSTYSFTTPPQPAISNIQFSPVTGALTGTEQVSWTTNVPSTSQISYGLVGGASQNQLDTTLTTSHQMTIDNLSYDTQYSLVATSVDSLGDVATSDTQVFKSGTDTRPPRFSDLTIQPSIVGTGASASGQLIVSWKTDKAGTSQVAYGEGTSTGFSAKTAVNNALVTNHVVVVSGLSTSEVYHVEAISSDNEGITGQSPTQTTIIAQPTDNALTVVFNSLHAIFGL